MSCQANSRLQLLILLFIVLEYCQIPIVVWSAEETCVLTDQACVSADASDLVVEEVGQQPSNDHQDSTTREQQDQSEKKRRQSWVDNVELGCGVYMAPSTLGNHSNLGIYTGIRYLADTYGVILPKKLEVTPLQPEPKPVPQEPETDCQSIAEIACDLDDFSTLCGAVVAAGLDGALSGDDKLTVFAPTNDAFAELGETLDAVVADVDILTDVLLLHVTAGEVFSTDLECSGLTPMLQGDDTRTICHANGSDGIFQKARGNSRSDIPEVVTADIEACNGVIHVIDGVLLP